MWLCFQKEIICNTHFLAKYYYWNAVDLQWIVDLWHSAIENYDLYQLIKMAMCSLMQQYASQIFDLFSTSHMLWKWVFRISQVSLGKSPQIFFFPNLNVKHVNKNRNSYSCIIVLLQNSYKIFKQPINITIPYSFFIPYSIPICFVRPFLGKNTIVKS